MHTPGLGVARKAAGLLRIPHVFAGSQCFQGWECSSSPTSGTTYRLVRGDLALTCVQSLILVALTAGSRAGAWLPRSLFRCVGWRVKDPGWWAFRLLWAGFMRFLVPVLSGWPGVAYTCSWTGGAGTT